MKTTLSLLSLLFVFVGCDAIDAMKATKDMKVATNAMNEKMDKTNRGIDSTNESVRLQKLILSKDDMLDEKNTKNLSPVALGMIPGAKKFGESATTEELMEYTYILLKAIRDEKPDDSLKDANGEFPADVVAAYDHQKMIQFSQVLTIAGFTPADKVESIINEQIYGGGLYQDEAYAFLMARVFFLGTYLDNSLLANPLKTIKKMEETVMRISSIDYLLKTPFKNEIKMSVTGFLKQDPIELSLYTDGLMEDIWNAPKLWKKVMNGFKNDLRDGNVITGTPANQANLSKRIDELKVTVQSYLDSWK